MGFSNADLCVLILSATAILFSVLQEGEIQLTASWYHTNGDLIGITYKNGHAPDDSEQLPRPIITDLDGDGQNEIVLVTREPKLKIFDFQTYSSSNKKDINNLEKLSFGSSQGLALQAEVSLLRLHLVKKGRQVVGLETGFIHDYSTSENRKQVIVVVTESWNVLCYDHKLKLLWEQTITLEKDLQHLDMDTHDLYLGELAIMINPHHVQVGDTGIIVVGGRLWSKLDLHSLKMHTDDQTAPEEYEEDYEDEDDPVQETLLDDGSHGKMLRGQHFSFYAFEGLTGNIRWKHEADDFHAETDANDLLHPQHAVHTGEVGWRTFKHSILDSLPHTWSSREDTRFELSHFERRRSGKDRQVHIKRKVKASSDFSKDMYKGVLRPHSDSEHVENPNTLVAHIGDGIEVVNLYTGQPVCRLTLNKGSIHVDLNGDGVIDHIENIASSPITKGEVHGEFSHLRHMSDCDTFVTTGVPPQALLFNRSICKWSIGFSKTLRQVISHRSVSAAQASLLNNIERSTDPVEALLPVVLPYLRRGSNIKQEILGPQKEKNNFDILGKSNSKAWDKLPKHYSSFFLVSSGILTAYRYDGYRFWQLQTKSDWSLERDSAEGGLELLSLHPSLVPFSLNPDGEEDHLLAVGQNSIALVSTHGDLCFEVPVSHIPVGKPTIGDFDNDGLNDVVIITTTGYYGFVLTRSVGNKALSFLMGLLLLALLITFFVKFANSAKNRVDGYVNRPRQQHSSRKQLGGFSSSYMYKSPKAQS